MGDASQLVLIIEATRFCNLSERQLIEAFDFKTLLIAQI